MENGVRKREWVKTAAIILLAVLLVLTFFSKTIMNASLPEVATQQVSSGAINARIRGQGTVEASEVYNVTIKQTRKVSSVLVKTGQEINVGDTLFVLEAEDSDELKQAETDLETLQQNYDKSLIEAGNTAAQENRDVQNARDDYNEALAIYRQYSTMDASQLATQKAASEAKLKELQTAKTTVDNQITKIKAEKEYTDAQATVTEHEATVKSLEAEKGKLLESLPLSYKDCSNASYYQTEIDKILQDRLYIENLTRYEKVFAAFSTLCDNDFAIMKECYEDESGISMIKRIEGNSTSAKYDKEGNARAIPGHNLSIAALGVFILWFCWFGFNCGSTTAASTNLGDIAMTTNLAAAAATLATLVVTWIRYGKPDVSMTFNGSLAGLVAITAGCDTVSNYSAIIIGLIAGILVVFSVEFFDKVAKIDDPVGAISVHGVCGFTGSILVGVFSPEYTLKTQVIGVLSTVAYVLVMAIIVFTIIDKTVGLRVTKGEELDGLDIHEHGCSAYADFNFRL